MVVQRTSLEEAILQKIKEGNGDINGMIELSERFEPAPGQLTYILKKFYLNKRIIGIKTSEGQLKLIIKDK